MSLKRIKVHVEYASISQRNRRSWFLFDSEQCRVISDLIYLMRKKFGFKRDSLVSLEMDGYSLLPSESIDIVRDNDLINVVISSVSKRHDTIDANHEYSKPSTTLTTMWDINELDMKQKKLSKNDDDFFLHNSSSSEEGSSSSSSSTSEESTSAESATFPAVKKLPHPANGISKLVLNDKPTGSGSNVSKANSKPLNSKGGGNTLKHPPVPPGTKPSKVKPQLPKSKPPSTAITSSKPTSNAITASKPLTTITANKPSNKPASTTITASKPSSKSASTAIAATKPSTTANKSTLSKTGAGTHIRFNDSDSSSDDSNSSSDDSDSSSNDSSPLIDTTVVDNPETEQTAKEIVNSETDDVPVTRCFVPFKANGAIQVGDHLKYKILELSPDYTPSYSDFKEGTVVSINLANQTVVLELSKATVQDEVERLEAYCNGKFSLSDEIEEESVEKVVEVKLSEMIEPMISVKN